MALLGWVRSPQITISSSAEVLHVHWAETGRVLGVIYVLTEGRESISFIRGPSMMFGVDEVLCVIRKVIVTS